MYLCSVDHIPVKTSNLKVGGHQKQLYDLCSVVVLDNQIPPEIENLKRVGINLCYKK